MLSAFSYLSVPLYIIAPLTIMSIATILVSKVVSILRKNQDKMLEQIYAYISVVEFVNRVMFIGNLWVSTKIFIFSLAFMNLVCTGVLGIFFFTLYMQPILVHSPHFKNLRSTYKLTYLFVIISSFIVGPNFIRLIYCKVFGTRSTSSDFNQHYFFVKPLNTIANFNLIFIGIHVLICIITLFSFPLSKDAWTIGAMGIALNLTLVIF